MAGQFICLFSFFSSICVFLLDISDVNADVSADAEADIDKFFFQGVDNWRDFIGFFSLRSYDTLQVD